MSLRVEGLSFGYGERKVLDNISIEAREGRLLSVLGPNGAGKSTLFRCILGLLKQYEGSVQIDGEPSNDMTPRQLARHIAYIPQSHNPAFNYTVFDMVLMGASTQGSVVSVPGVAEKEAAGQALERLGIAGFAGRDYLRISGGERQLVLIARALAQRSRILVLDEPTANLDYGNQIRVLDCVRALAQEGYTVIQSTHHPEQAYLFSDDVVAMRDGRVIAEGEPKEVMTAELMQGLYGIEVEMESLRGDRMRVGVPINLLKEREW